MEEGRLRIHRTRSWRSQGSTRIILVRNVSRKTAASYPNNVSRPLGNFEDLPKEIIFEILHRLPLQFVGLLSVTSSAFRVLVSEWVTTRRVIERIDTRFPLVACPAIYSHFDNLVNPRTETEGALIELARALSTSSKKNPDAWTPYSLAVLCKSLTCLDNTPKRIQFVFDLFAKVLDHDKSNSAHGMCSHITNHGVEGVDDDSGSKRPSREWSYFKQTVLFSSMLHTFVRGWEESEFETVLDAVEKKFVLKDRLVAFLLDPNKNGVCVGREMNLRLVLRCLLWDFVGNDYSLRASWMLAFMKKFVGDSPKLQASFFYLAFGPPCSDDPGHHDDEDDAAAVLSPPVISKYRKVLMTELFNHAIWDVFNAESPMDFVEGKESFYTMAQAICSCLNVSSNWKKETMPAVLDNLFQTPEPWKRDNIAGLLLFCSEKLIFEYVRTKLEMGTKASVKLAARLLLDMIIMSHRFENEFTPMRGIGKIFDIVCAYPDLLQKNRNDLTILLARDIRRILYEEVWKLAIDEVANPQTDTDEEEMLEIIQKLGTHVTTLAYGRQQTRRKVKFVVPPSYYEPKVTTNQDSNNNNNQVPDINNNNQVPDINNNNQVPDINNNNQVPDINNNNQVPDINNNNEEVQNEQIADNNIEVVDVDQMEEDEEINPSPAKKAKISLQYVSEDEEEEIEE